MPGDDCLYVLAEREDKVRDMDAAYLLTYLVSDGYASYLSTEEAEESRQRGGAYDEPGRTRVVGFRVKPFLPKRKGKKR